MKKTYYSTCEHCGARLDPGERCDCREAKAEIRQGKAKAERRKAS